MKSISIDTINEQFDSSIKSVIKAFHIKTEYYENEILSMQKNFLNKEEEFSLLEKQLNKANFDYDQLCKTNENLVVENKQMMEEISGLKKTLKKIDEWKKKFFDILKEDKIEKDMIKNLLQDFPTYYEIKENLEINKNYNYNRLNHDSMNINSNTNTYGKEYLLSSFNSNNNPNGNNKTFEDKGYQNLQKENFYLDDFYSDRKQNREFEAEKSNFSPRRNFDERKFYSDANLNTKVYYNLEGATEEEKRVLYENINMKKFIEKISNDISNSKTKDNNEKYNLNKNGKIQEEKNYEIEQQKGINKLHYINQKQEKNNIPIKDKYYEYSPKVNSFNNTTYNFSPRSESHLNFNYKNILERGKAHQSPQDEKMDGEIRNKIVHNRNYSRNTNPAGKHMNLEVNETTNDNDRYPTSVTRTSQYLLSSKFFAECRNSIKKNEYDLLIEILKLFNKNEISKNEAFERIGRILQPYQKLHREFRKIFLK